MGYISTIAFFGICPIFLSSPASWSLHCNMGFTLKVSCTTWSVTVFWLTFEVYFKHTDTNLHNSTITMFFLFSCFHNLLPLNKCQAILPDEAVLRGSLYQWNNDLWDPGRWTQETVNLCEYVTHVALSLQKKPYFLLLIYFKELEYKVLDLSLGTYKRSLMLLFLLYFSLISWPHWPCTLPPTYSFPASCYMWSLA